MFSLGFETSKKKVRALSQWNMAILTCILMRFQGSVRRQKDRKTDF